MRMVCSLLVESDNLDFITSQRQKQVIVISLTNHDEVGTGDLHFCDRRSRVLSAI